MIGHIHSTESFGAADGRRKIYSLYARLPYAGAATVIIRIRKMDGGDEVTADEILKRALRFKPYWGKDGGITISGGEPLLQIDFCN